MVFIPSSNYGGYGGNNPQRNFTHYDAYSFIEVLIGEFYLCGLTDSADCNSVTKRCLTTFFLTIWLNHISCLKNSCTST
jgi:hypothetical protein